MLKLLKEEAAAALAAARITADPAGSARRVRRELTELDIALAQGLLGRILELLPQEEKEEFLRELRRNS